MGKVLIISASFYEDYKAMLLDGAIDELKKHNIKYEVLEVPGCFEIPAAISMAIETGNYDGYIALGCVIRGETTHYDYVCQESARGINDLAIAHKLPLGYGIITAENDDQAKERADIKGINVGGRAANACVKMLGIKKGFNLHIS